MIKNIRIFKIPFYTFIFVSSIGVSIIAVFLLLATTSLVNHARNVHDFNSDTFKEGVARRINSIEEVVHGMRALFDASNQVDSDEFRLLSKGVLGRHSYMLATMYLPVVPHDRKNAFESDMHENGFITFAIKERVEGRLQEVSKRVRYLPVLYKEPFSPRNAKQLGLDFLNNENLEPVINRAISSSLAAYTGLDPFNTGRKEFIVFKAVYAGKDTPATIEERRRTANGIIAVQIDVEKLLDVNTLVEDARISFYFDEKEEESFLFQSGLRHEDGLVISRFVNTHEIRSEDRTFYIDIDKPLYYRNINMFVVLGAASTGLLISFLLLMQVYNFSLRNEDLQKRNKQIEAVVDERTHELAMEKEYAQTTLEAICDAVIATDANARVEYINPIAERMVGLDEHEVLGRHVSEVFPLVEEVSRKQITDLASRCLLEKEIVRVSEHALLINRHGNEYAVESTAAPLYGRDGEISGVVLVSHDVSESRSMAKRMLYQATHDALTGLPNRTLLMDRTSQIISRVPWNKKIVAVLFFDLDRFKHVNDTLGHDVGDELLIQVAARLKTKVRQGDMVSRLGGDEFVVVLGDVADLNDVYEVADKIIAAFEQPFELENEEFFVSSSFGISLAPRDGQDVLDLMKKADTAMYRAKAMGKNNFIFYNDDMGREEAHSLNVETELRRAVERNEFVLYYQPQVDANTGKIVGAEALVRWQHPKRGLLMPIEFISVAEETGIVVPMGRWVIAEACRQTKAWLEQGLFTRVSVNIAALQFNRGCLIQDVKDALRLTGLHPHHLELEITESTLASDSEASMKTLNQLNEMGIRISIDDFGTGYSSLAYLKRFPLSELKVDRCFVKDIIDDQDDAAICAAVIAMAHNLNLKVVAEGVENLDQLEFLRQHQCDLIQGYLYSPPVPADAFVALLAEQQPSESQTTVLT